MRRATINGRMNRTHLNEAVAIELGMSSADGALVVDAVLDVIARTVAAGHIVAITNFGTWIPVQAAARTARNPQDGTPVFIPAQQDVRFRVSPRLREVVRAADTTATLRKHPKTPR